VSGFYIGRCGWLSELTQTCDVCTEEDMFHVLLLTWEYIFELMMPILDNLDLNN